MLKNRTLLIGIGIGMMAGALLLQLLFAVEQQDARFSMPAQEPLTADEVKQQAEELGLTLLSDGDKVYTQKEVDRLVSEAKKIGSKAASSAALGNKPSDIANDSKDSGAMMAVYIMKGTDSATLSEILRQLGVIKEVQAFENLMTVKQANGKIQPGLKHFTKGMSLQNIIDIIIKP
ncbi:hypothetical protein [Paenibacillus gansuensis]|uniref:Aminodeoxychorismate lyase n=1 Tax=Paenibacillus gansuensis TaxID=306542 RepID=A0ABW5PES1_9BACL